MIPLKRDAECSRCWVESVDVEERMQGEWSKQIAKG